jgi:Zn-dependent protease with chaperone function
VTRDEFDGYIQRLGKISRERPRVYAVRIICLVVLAYVYLTVILLGSLALCLAMIPMVFYVPATAKFAFIGLVAFGGMFLAVARGLWVKLQAPRGQSITRQQAPKLFSLLDELRTALDCQPFHQVLLTADTNAGVVQVPRLGIFGWHRNYLVLGLPLMQYLPLEEFKAVLGHEFAHSSRGHGRFGNWLYRVRRTWAQIFQEMAKRRTRFGAVLFKFLNWFWPIFNAHAFVLARANEYEADACAVRLAGADAVAACLIRTRVQGAWMGEKFWPAILSSAKSRNEPPPDVMLVLEQELKKGPPVEDASRWLQQGFLMQTNNVDTHPCLKDRLRAIGRLPAEIESGKIVQLFPARPAQSAADLLLGGYANEVAQQMSQEWRKWIAPQWTARHQQAQKLAGELDALEKPAEAPPTAAQVWEKARRIVELEGVGSAIPALQTVLALEPKHAGANFVLGRHYLQTDDPQGVSLIETAMAADPMLTSEGCGLLHAHFNRTGQAERLRPLEDSLELFQKKLLVAQQERARITAADIFLEHGLGEPQLAQLRKVVSSEPAVAAAAIARKQVQHFPNSPCFAVCLKIKARWWQPRSQKANREIVRRVLKQLSLPGHFLVFVKEKNLKRLGAKVFAAPAAVIFEREK